MKNKVIAIVPAAGLGKRFGEGTNKPLENLRGRPLLVWTLETLGAMEEIREIIPVVKVADMGYVAGMLERHGLTKVRKIAPGGKERQDSVFQGLKLIDDRKCVVLVHDGVRPLIGQNTIRNALNQLKDCDGVAVGVPVKDTIKEVLAGNVVRTLKREMLWAVQTPQIFPFDTIWNAYERAVGESFYSTDDSALVERYGGRVKLAMGSYTNIKITTPDDLPVAEIFLNQRGAKS